MIRFILLVLAVVSGTLWWTTAAFNPWGIVFIISGVLFLLACLIKAGGSGTGSGTFGDWDFGGYGGGDGGGDGGGGGD